MCLGLAPITSCARRESSGDGAKGILLVTFDTCRADRFGATGRIEAVTPAFDALARDGVVFERAYAPTPLTLPSHSSLFTGLYPFRHGVRDNGIYTLGEEAVTIADVLSDAGFATGAFVSSFPLVRRFGLDPSFDVYDDDLSVDDRAVTGLTYSERRGEYATDAAIAFLEASGSRDVFCWVHFFDPHGPYDPPEPYQERCADDPYDGEIAYADRCLGRLLGALEESGRSDDFLVIVTADHGEGLGDHGESTHGVFVYDPAVRVPLVLRADDLASGHGVSSLVRLVDVMPTILEWAGAEVPSDLDGESLLDLARGRDALDENRDAYVESFTLDYQYGWSKLFGIVRDRWKYIEAPRPELYDLIGDPRESRNRIDADDEATRAIVDELASRLDAWRATSVDGPGRRRQVSAAERRRLETLGYATGSPETAANDVEPSAELIDPKDAVRFTARLDEARERAMAGALDEAESIVQSILERNPENAMARAALATILRSANRLDDALRENRRALAIHPGLVSAHRQSGAILHELGRLDEAEAEYREAMRIDSGSVRTYLGLARVLLDRGERDEALRFLERAGATEPHESAAHYELGEIWSRLGDDERALAAYETSLASRPSSPTPFLKVVDLLVGRGDLARAIEMAERAARAFPDVGGVQATRGAVLARADRLEDAARAFERALELGVGAVAASSYAAVMIRSGRFEDASVVLERNLLRPGVDPGVWKALAQRLAGSLGRRDAGVRWMRRYLERVPDDEEARRWLRQYE